MTSLRAAASRIRAGSMAVATVALLLGGLAGAVVTPLAVEDQVVDAVIESRSPALTTLAHVVTTLGELWPVLLVAATVGVLVRRRPEAPRIHLLMLLGIGGATAIVGVLKLVVARARPEVALVSTWTPAYPSGHAVRAAAGYGLVIWACHRYLRHRVALWVTGTVLTATVILAIAWSRILLVVHLPSDVVVGLLIGTIWLLVVLRAVPAHALMEGAERNRGAAPTRPADPPGRGDVADGPHRRRGLDDPDG